MTQCPDLDQLAGLLDERLDDDTSSSVAAHLEHCVACQATLEALTAERFSGSSWREPADSTPADDSPTEATTWGGSPPVDEGDARSRRQIFGASPRQPSSLHVLPGDLPGPPAATGNGDATPYVPEVDGYDILGRLGRGGMGIVYRARQRGLDRLVALKMLRSGGFADPEALARFRIEVRAAARLRHPNVVQVFEVGESRGLPFVSLELLEGGSLEARLAGEPRPADEAAELVATLARGIASAHRSGIVHRDLKPANVLFTRDGIAKITDFGLAKRLDEDDGATESGQVMGSPSFMAPEQARGETHAVTPAADVYSLGAILYQALTGRPPFKGGSALETLRLVIEAEPVAPSRLRPGLARDLETICLKALAKEPAQRYASADDLADDLDRFRLGAPVRARRVRAWERAWKWSRRNPTAAGLVAAGVIAAALGTWIGVGTYWNEVHLQTLRRDATADLGRASRSLNEGRWADALEILQPTLARIESEPALNDLGRRVGETIGSIRQLDQLLRAARRAELADARWLEAIRAGDSRSTRPAGSPRRSEASRGGDPRPVREAIVAALDRAGRIERAADGQPTGWRGPTLGGLGATGPAVVEPTARGLVLLWVEATARTAPGEDPITQARSALALLDRTDRDGPRDLASAGLRARLLDRLGDAEAARRVRADAAGLRPQTAADHLALGRERYLGGDIAGAIDADKAALQLAPDLFPAQLALAVSQLQAGQPDAAWAGLTTCLQREANLGGLRALRGVAAGEIALRRLARPAGTPPPSPKEVDRQLEAAEADFRAAADLDPSPEDRLAVLLQRGSMRTLAGRFDAALADFEAACTLGDQSWEARLNRGQVLRRLGRVPEAIDQFSAALTLAPDEPGLFRARAIARLDERSGLPKSATTEPALADLDEAIRLDPPGSPDLAADLARRARLRLRLGRHGEALRDAEAALETAPDLADATLSRVQALRALKRYPEMIAACDSAIRHHPSDAELFELRGLARSSTQDYDGAIADQTHALTLDPSRLSARLQRGWAYLLAEAGRPALTDFDAVIRREPGRAEAYGGRGYALALVGQHRAATDDAETLLQRSGTDARAAYNAARIYARASASLGPGTPGGRRPLANSALAQEYGDRAIDLLQLAVEWTPDDRRAAFVRDVIGGDPILASLRQFPQFARLAPPRGYSTP